MRAYGVWRWASRDMSTVHSVACQPRCIGVAVRGAWWDLIGGVVYVELGVRAVACESTCELALMGLVSSLTHHSRESVQKCLLAASHHSTPDENSVRSFFAPVSWPGCTWIAGQGAHGVLVQARGVLMGCSWVLMGCSCRRVGCSWGAHARTWGAHGVLMGCSRMRAQGHNLRNVSHAGALGVLMGARWVLMG